MLAEAERAGLVAKRDFHLISTDIVEGRVTAQRLEDSAYTHQPDLVGAEAWRLLQALIGQEAVTERTVLVPYQRYPIRAIKEGEQQ
ncbi:MAG: hypothetical protein BWY76_02259 [bacterium ADurb.Bin429]|nr:MAG: hypothetical protein BWY76_02259 [bacterium ADurb.Bin429]